MLATVLEFYSVGSQFWRQVCCTKPIFAYTVCTRLKLFCMKSLQSYEYDHAELYNYGEAFTMQVQYLYNY